jgi:hypothetical protein
MPRYGAGGLPPPIRSAQTARPNVSVSSETRARLRHTSQGSCRRVVDQALEMNSKRRDAFPDPPRVNAGRVNAGIMIALPTQRESRSACPLDPSGMQRKRARAAACRGVTLRVGGVCISRRCAVLFTGSCPACQPGCHSTQALRGRSLNGLWRRCARACVERWWWCVCVCE